MSTCLHVCLYVTCLPFCFHMQKVTLRGEGGRDFCLRLHLCFGEGILFEICHCCTHEYNVDTNATIFVLFLTVFCPMFVLCVHMYCTLSDCAVVS